MECADIKYRIKMLKKITKSLLLLLIIGMTGCLQVTNPDPNDSEGGDKKPGFPPAEVASNG